MLFVQSKNGTYGLECFQKLNEEKHHGFEYFHVKTELGKTCENIFIETNLTSMIFFENNKGSRTCHLNLQTFSNFLERHKTC